MKKTKIAARKGSKGKKLGSLTTADLVVLSLLTERSMHGYELLGEYERQEVADWASVSKAQVYYAIQKLAGLKLIQSQKSDSHATDRDRTVFTPTAAGRKELEKGLARPEWAQTRIPQPFTTWLGLSIHLKDKEIGTILGERKKFLESELKKEKESLKYIDALESDRAKVGADIVRLVILQIETELRWLGDLMTRKF
jgi:DNA-binding PadR family transcriptional regulator